jgi:uncharacterized protein
MSFETAKKALDLFFHHSQDSSSVTISFYGGEPLLNFDLIEQVILYSEKIFNVKEITFTITTNGLLLDLNRCSFLKQHNVYITVSIDGPKDINDRFRKNKYGMGSFDIVKRNLIAILRVMPNYYKRYISINSVITPLSEITLIKNFFINEMKIKESKLSMSMINTEGLDLIFDEIPNISNSQYQFLIDKEKDEVFNIHKKIYGDKSALPSVYHHFGPCVPVAKKLFVSTEGKFFPCEKVCELNDICCFGDVNNGINYSSIYNIVNIGIIGEEKCKSCWAIRYCSMCIAEISGNYYDETVEIKNNLCNARKRNILNSFRRIIESNS